MWQWRIEDDLEVVFVKWFVVALAEEVLSLYTLKGNDDGPFACYDGHLPNSDGLASNADVLTHKQPDPSTL